jgi:broad specificity phosphatase PhoE
MTTRIYLARHGETDWNLNRRLQGWNDQPLNATGQAQARALAAHLEAVQFDAVYCSSLLRSRTTAEPLAHRAPLHVRDGLREQCMGRFEGVCLDGSQPELAAEFERRIRDVDDELDGGESRRRHRSRVQAVLDEVLRAHPGGTAVIVGHGGSNAVVARLLLGKGAPRNLQTNDTLDLFECANGGARLVEHVRYGSL